MLVNFFYTLKEQQVPVTLRELLDLLMALQKRVVFADQEQFYFLSRTCLVKDEKYYDKFDQAFGVYFEGLDLSVEDLFEQLIPDEWLRKQLEKSLSPEQMADVKNLGDFEKLMEAFKKRLEEQKERHQGGNKWIGTGGTSPFGAFGYNPAGFRMAGESRHKRAVKVWEKRQFANLDDTKELGTRNIKVALKRLRKMARHGPADSLDIDGTIRSTADNAGWLDIQWAAERRNQVKVLLFFDVGGSMDPYVEVCEELFSAARTEFKHMVYYYFHNCLYESVWQNNLRSRKDLIPTWDVLNKYGQDYKVILVGDAAMSPYEVSHVGGSVEHWNEEPGAVWLKRLVDHFSSVVWLNPEPEKAWSYTQSTKWIQEIMEHRMYTLTLKGIEDAMRELTR